MCLCPAMADSEEANIRIVVHFHYSQWLNFFANFTTKYMYTWEYSGCKVYVDRECLSDLMLELY